MIRRRNSQQKIKESNRAGSGFESHQISRNCREISLGEGGHPHHRRRETAISLSLPAGGQRGDARCLRVVCVCRGEARPQLLKYPATQTHRIRSTPPPSKNNRAVSSGGKINRVKDGQKPEYMRMGVVRWTPSAQAHACHQTCNNQKGPHMSP